ncbi:MAG: hypothetical protein ACI9IJ_001712, partial [Psychromonas sp.]
SRSTINNELLALLFLLLRKKNKYLHLALRL